MPDIPTGFLICWAVFCGQAILAHHITACCITGRYPRRDIQLLPIVMLTIAGTVAFALRTALEFAPEIRGLRTEAGIYVSCLGQLLGIFSAAILHRRVLIALAARERRVHAF